MKFTVLLPLTDNDGADLTAVVQATVQSLAIQFGGVSVEGTVEGIWIDNGKQFSDVSKRVTVVCDDDRADEVRQRVTEIGRELKQLAMYFEVHASKVEFIRID